MGTVRFTDEVRCGFGVLDQHGLVKFNAVVHFVLDVYGRAMRAWTGQSRAEYLRATGTGPVTSHARITRWSHQVGLDDPLEVAVATDYGFVPGTDGAPPRYGGQDQFTFTDATGNVVAHWQQQWFHHHVATGQLLHEPAPGIPTDQDQELARPPRRPNIDEPSPTAGAFRWTLRETDLNQHVNVAAYLERAENSMADVEDTVSVSHVRLWFRRPAFLGNPMHTRLGTADGSRLVELWCASPDELCATIAFDVAPPEEDVAS